MKVRVLIAFVLLAFATGMTPAWAIFQNGTEYPSYDPPLSTDGTWVVIDEFIPGGPGGFFTGAPWTFNEVRPVLFEITDLYVVGDEFEVFDFGASVFTTPDLPDYQQLGLPPFQSPPWTANPDVAMADGRFSTGSWWFAPGPHSISILALATPPNFNDNTVGFRATLVPEPATLLLLCAGLVGAGAFRLRRRRK